MQAQELAARNEVDVQGRVTVFAQAFRSLHFTVCMRTRRHLHLSCSGLAHAEKCNTTISGARYPSCPLEPLCCVQCTVHAATLNILPQMVVLK